MNLRARRPGEARTAETTDLDRSLVRGIAWTGVGKWATQIISWISTPIVARLLSPADYGVASMALVYIGLVLLINEFGLGSAIVQRRDLTEDQLARLGGLSVLLGALFFMVSVTLATPVARFFGNREVGPVIIALSLIFLTSSFQALPRSLLTRDLRFQRLAALDSVEAVVNTVVTLILAALGFRYWALVLGGIASRVAGTILALCWRGHRLTWPTQFKTIAAPVAFGAHIVIASLAWYAFRNADLTVIGRRLGTAALGAYTIGATLASIPVDRLGALIARATPAIFAMVQDDRAALRRYVLALTEGITLLTFPAAVGLALVAEEFVLVVLGEQWREAINPLRILALAAVYRSVVPLMNQVLVATGESKRIMQATIAIAVVLPPLFYLASPWGIGAIALIWLTAYPIASLAFFVRYAFAACDMTMKRYLIALWPATSATLAMAAAVLAVELLATDMLSPAILLVAKCVVGAATYVGLVWYLHHSRLRSFLAMLRAPRPQENSALGDQVSAS